MNYLHEHLNEVLGEWLEAVLVTVGTLLAIGIARTALRGSRLRRRWNVIDRLSPTVINFIAAVGFRVFVEVAPLDEKLTKYLGGAAFILVIFFLLALIRTTALTGIEYSSSKTQYASALNQHGFTPLLRNFLNLFVFLAGSIMVLKHFNYDVLSLLTALGVGSLAIGLAAKETLSNMISGFILIMDRNLRPGDRISLAGSNGDVMEIGLRSTRIKTGDGNTMIVPNFDLVNNRIVNLSEPSREATASATLRVPYSAPFAQVREICTGVLKKTPHAVLDRGSSVFLSSLADGYQTVQVSFWLDDMDNSGEALSSFNENALIELGRAQIKLFEPAPMARL